MKTKKQFNLYTFTIGKCCSTEADSIEQAISNFNQRLNLDPNGYHHPNMKYNFDFNDITKTEEVVNIIKDKYGSHNHCHTTVHHYEQIVRPRVEATATSEPIPLKCIEIDETSYNALDEADRDIIYCYDWETARNEAKRDIKLIDRKYVADILSEHAEKFE